jgi:transcription initiation factor IIF auxiliary subunit
MPEEFTIKQWEKYEGGDPSWWEWAVWVEGRDEALDLIDFVEWILHPSFPNPIRKISERTSKFRLEAGGWGVFEIVARVQMTDGAQIKLWHYLKLHYPDGKPCTK